MNMNTDPEWLLRMAEKEAGGIVSVGGLTSRLKAEAEATTTEPIHQPPPSPDTWRLRAERAEARVAKLEGEIDGVMGAIIKAGIIVCPDCGKSGQRILHERGNPTRLTCWPCRNDFDAPGRPGGNDGSFRAAATPNLPSALRVIDDEA